MDRSGQVIQEVAQSLRVISYSLVRSQGYCFFLWALSGIFIVAQAERAVVLRFGKYLETVEPGPHWVPRFIESYTKINEQKISSYSYQSNMLTHDENIVFVSVAVQYRVNKARDYLFNVVAPEVSLQQATASSLRQVIGNTDLEQVLTTGREQVRQSVQKQLNQLLAQYNTGLMITDVSLQPAKAPEEVKPAFDDAINAQEDEERFKSQAHADGLRFEQAARGKGLRLLNEAKAYQKQVVLIAKAKTARYLALLPQFERDPKVTRDRLYFDSMESLLRKATKVFIDTKGGNQVFYLPLDQLAKLSKKRAFSVPTIEPVNDELPEPHSRVLDRPARSYSRGER